MVSTQEKFIIVPAVLTNNDNMVILTDVGYWAINEEKLQQWCKDNDSKFAGMTVTFPDPHTLTVFILRWS